MYDKTRGLLHRYLTISYEMTNEQSHSLAIDYITKLNCNILNIIKLVVVLSADSPALSNGND